MESNPLVWVIDSQHWARACIRAELMERGCNVDGFEELAAAVTAFRDPFRAKPAIVVLELGGLEFRLNELNELIRSPIPLIALASELDLHREQLKDINWPHLLRRPFSIGELADLIDKIVK